MAFKTKSELMNNEKKAEEILHHVHELLELLDDLHQDLGIAVSDDVHAAKVRVERGGISSSIR